MVRVLALIPVALASETCSDKVKATDDVLLQVRAVGSLQKHGAPTTNSAGEDAGCPCIPLSDIDASDSPGYPLYKTVDYPAAVGTSCKAWDKAADPGCSDASDGWCVDSWCYVDPCTCTTGNAVKSSYFPNLKTISGDPVYYSYATCGVGTDDFTCTSDDPTNRACTCNADEQSCGDGCTWDNGKCVGSELAGGCAAAGAESANCPCIDLADIVSSKQSAYPHFNDVNYPAAVGTSCKAWDKSADPSCASKSDGWCVDSWCYVDPCTCQNKAVKSSYFPDLETSSGDPVYYSYATCGATDDFTCQGADPTKRACTCNADETACGAADGCAWNGGQCVGEELVNGCTAEVAEDGDCPCIDLSSIDASEEDAYPLFNAVDYPAVVGTTCKAWDKSSDPSCSDASDGWCVDSWCYVDPCTCKTGNAKKSSYFPKLKTITGDPVYYSYATCGVGTDDFTCTSDDPTNRACTCNADETTCGGASGCAWKDGKCIGEELAGGCLADKAAPAIPNPDCPCIALSNLDSSNQADYPDYKKVAYPDAVGTSCRAWDSKADPSCADATDGWCVDAWCYVDPCSCKTGDAVKSSYFPNLDTMHGQPVMYSYATCGVGTDDFTCSSSDPTNRACTCNANEAACGTATGCSWNGNRCIASELLGC